MSTPFDRAIYNADQANLAIAILGGATAHSYQEMGLRGTWALDNPMANYAPAPLIAGMSSAPAQPTRQASSALNLDAHSGKPASEVSMPGLDWPLSQLMDKQEPAEGADAAESLAVDLRGNALDDDFMGSGSLAQDPEEGAIAIANAAESVLEDFSSLPASLLELIEQALEDARANQEEISPEFDGSGSGQAVVRDWIDSSLRDAAASAREFFQGEIRGEGREAIQTTVDALGSPLLSEAFEPLLAVDYYAAAADVINGLLDAVAQPIGSASLPRIGPLLDNPREELATYLG